MEDLRRSVNSMIDIPLVSQVLMQTARYPKNAFTERVFVRQEYIDFLEEWLRIKGTRRRGKILVGSPGIGKSVCSYLALELELRDPRTAVIWLWDSHYGKEIQGCVGWGNEVFTANVGRVVDYFNWHEARGQITFVYDGRANLHYMGFSYFDNGLVVHSPSANIAGSEKEGLLPWCMKPWTGEEIDSWAEKQGYTLNVARELFDILGGAIRLFATVISEVTHESQCSDQARHHIDRAVQHMFPANTSESAGQGSERQAAHRVLHWYPVVRTRGVWNVFFCSHYARQRYLEIWRSNNIVNLLQRPSGGYEFEAGVHGHIEKNGRCHFTVRELEGPDVVRRTQKELRWTRIKKYWDASELVRGRMSYRLCFIRCRWALNFSIVYLRAGR